MRPSAGGSCRGVGGISLGRVGFLGRIGGEERLQTGVGRVFLPTGGRSVSCHLGILQQSVEPRQRFLERLGLVSYLEFQEGGFLDDVLRSPRIVDTRQLHDDAIVARFLDDGLRDTELVDAVTHHLERVVDRFALVSNMTL